MSHEQTQLRVGGDDPHLSSRLSDELDVVNLAATGADDQASLTVSITERGELIAGLAGWTWGGGAGIEMMWVRADRRGSGIGRQVVMAAEAEATRRGCTDISVTSFTFQAPGFYQRLGYVVTGHRFAMPAGAADVVMWKSLTNHDWVRVAAVVDFDGDLDSGRSYEDTALSLVAAHGGRVDLRELSADRRTEVHVLWFPDRAAYEAFVADPARIAARPERGVSSRLIVLSAGV